jgi:hypothetical protein
MTSEFLGAIGENDEPDPTSDDDVEMGGMGDNKPLLSHAKERVQNGGGGNNGGASSGGKAGGSRPSGGALQQDGGGGQGGQNGGSGGVAAMGTALFKSLLRGREDDGPSSSRSDIKNVINP